MITDVLHYVDKNLEESLERLFDFLRFPSISTDPAYKDSCAQTADWLVKMLRSIGFDARACATEGHPIVLAHDAGPQDRAAGKEPIPHVLFYGHYDVQPVDPIDLWDHDPFDPKIKEQAGHKVIAARGASDDKGQVMTFIEACRAYKETHGNLPVKVSILLEGEEESGSPSLMPFLKKHKKELQADFALVCDTSMWDRQTPSITVGLRGCVAQEIVIKGANRDLHSGSYGGAAANPLTILSSILGALHDEEGRITIPGFYEGVQETPEPILKMWEKLGCSSESFLGPVGLWQKSGEKDRSLLESVWARPTAEINGICGGYTEAGFKTVIPAQAKAKISFRLVHKQDAQKIVKAFQAFVRARIPQDCSVEFIDHGASPALQLPYDLPFLDQAKKALAAEWATAPVLIAAGGSIPIVADFQSLLGMQSLLVGFALEDDNIHSPNEKYDLNAFHKGQRSWVRILAAFAHLQ